MPLKNRVNLNNLFYVYKILEYGSIKKTSEVLGLSSSTISEHVKNTEALFGTKLFLRDKKGLSPTLESKTLHKYLHLVFKTLDKINFLYENSEDQKNLVDIGVLSSVTNTRTSRFLLPLFFDEKILVKIHQADSQYLIKSFIHGELDILITDFKPDLQSLTDLQNEYLGSINYILVYNPKFSEVKENYEKKNIVHLVNYLNLTETRLLSEQYFSKNGINMFNRGESDDVTLIKEVVLNSSCSAILPKSLIDRELESGQLALLDDSIIGTSPLYASYMGNESVGLIKSLVSSLKTN